MPYPPTCNRNYLLVINCCHYLHVQQITVTVACLTALRKFHQGVHCMHQSIVITMQLGFIMLWLWTLIYKFHIHACCNTDMSLVCCSCNRFYDIVYIINSAWLVALQSPVAISALHILHLPGVSSVPSSKKSDSGLASGEFPNHMTTPWIETTCVQMLLMLVASQNKAESVLTGIYFCRVCVPSQYTFLKS